MQPLLDLLVPKKIGLSSEEVDHSLVRGKNTHTKINLSSEETTSLKLICVTVAIHAFQHYLKRDLLQFDALVGENACQIRAAMLQEMIADDCVDESHLAHLILKLESIRERLLAEQPLRREESLEALTHQEKYLILAHLLTCTRDPHNQLRTEESSLNLFSAGKPLNSLKSLVELTYQAKRSFSEISVKYVQRMATDFPLLKKFMNQEEDANSQGLKCTALYYNFQVLLENIKRHRRILMLHIEGESKLLYQADEKGILQRVQNETSLEGDTPVFVIFYKVNQRKALKPLIESLEENVDERVYRAILAQAADHPLFIGHKIEKAMHLFEHQDVKPYIESCKGSTIDEIEAQLTQVPPKQLKMAEIACKPAPLAEVILAHHVYKRLKVEGQEDKKIIQILHIYCNTLQKELIMTHNILEIKDEK